VSKTDETLKTRARAMRAEPTPAETKLWNLLRGKRFEGARFTRQAIIGNYIVDFAAPSSNLAIEIDGDTHGGQVEYDAARTFFLERQGYRVIRFTNSDVLGNVDGVLTAIAVALVSPTPPPPRPSPRGGRGKWL
jgi:very-short-patch-repair endonuclease